jgi:hypothetical protein
MPLRWIKARRHGGILTVIWDEATPSNETLYGFDFQSARIFVVDPASTKRRHHATRTIARFG